MTTFREVTTYSLWKKLKPGWILYMELFRKLKSGLLNGLCEPLFWLIFFVSLVPVLVLLFFCVSRLVCTNEYSVPSIKMSLIKLIPAFNKYINVREFIKMVISS